MSRRKRTATTPAVRWSVTDQVLGGLTIKRVITLHHFMPFTGDRALLDMPLSAYTPPTAKEPWWVVRALGGETWRMQWYGSRSGFVYEVWWVSEWRRRQKAPPWLQVLAGAIEYGKRKRWDDDGEEIVPPEVPAALEDEQQLTLF